MPSVWYVGPARRRLITGSDWARKGIASNDVEWKPSNGWSIPENQFSVAQLEALDAMNEFLLGAPEGPRDGLPIEPDPDIPPDPDPSEGVGVSFVSDIDGLTIYFGRGPLPDPASVADTVYFMLPQ